MGSERGGSGWAGVFGNRERSAALLLLAASLALLLAHSFYYAFLTDDAFISFRYSRNLVEGHGLVFNAGEYTEGYTNFLWVLILAAGMALGAPPEQLANVLSLLATIGVWALVAVQAYRQLEEGDSFAWIALPCLLLASTRSFAVWSTSGLETRCFELCIFGACVALVYNVRREQRGHAGRFGAAAALFGLGALLRPDGLLLAATSGAAAAGLLFVGRSRIALARRHLVPAAALVAVVAAHFVFRRLYYGDWLPNTWHAKVGGAFSWEMGGSYLLAFALEYGAWLWLPLIVVACQARLSRGDAALPVIFAAAALPHALYVASVGGDHFEYRPLDLQLPFAFLLLADGARVLWRRARWRGALTAYVACVFALLVAIPAQLALEFPDDYQAGFPAIAGASRESFGSPDAGLLRYAPGLAQLQGLHQDTLWDLSSHFVAIRQEEHSAFLNTVFEEGTWLRDAASNGTLPTDTHIAINAIGALAYTSGLRVLDRHGLTDREVARSSPAGNLIAHEKHATLDYAREAGVDFWAADLVHLAYPVGEPMLADNVRLCREARMPCFLGRLSEHHRILALLPQGLAAARARFPRLRLTSVYDLEGTGALLRSE